MNDYQWQGGTLAATPGPSITSVKWAPAYQDVTLQRKNDARAFPRFSGKFNFSNFQCGLTLTAGDFPEFSSLDLVADYVVLKVFVPAADPATVPEMIYLGRVGKRRRR